MFHPEPGYVARYRVRQRLRWTRLGPAPAWLSHSGRTQAALECRVGVALAHVQRAMAHPEPRVGVSGGNEGGGRTLHILYEMEE